MYISQYIFLFCFEKKCSMVLILQKIPKPENSVPKRLVLTSFNNSWTEGLKSFESAFTHQRVSIYNPKRTPALLTPEISSGILPNFEEKIPIGHWN